ncbi:hypothetical protein F53441_6202 [Fusarium austroafricanum]|uniref:N-acetyltransferase domain-containing protein n=1 Tax=Fusarium austroafricanum TaxID=2364996 RepID=A0A8H4KK65_9HYPO|nr:hypothetical protein F53441_6202 [Fusarium austroafricanum]
MESATKPVIDLITVKTTLPVYPLLPNCERKTFRTERLSMRPMTEGDFDFCRAVRTDPDGMKWSSKGRPDIDIEETRANFNSRLPPNDVQKYDWVICLLETGEPIGIGGTCLWTSELGWPSVGYIFLKAHWGKGYASEFLKAFLDEWWSLPRNEVELAVDKNSIRDGDGEVKKECLSAITVSENAPSQNVLRKCGFAFTSSWPEVDANDPPQEVILNGFVGRKGEVIV